MSKITNVRLKQLLDAVVDAATEEYGQPEYRYYKKTVIFRRGKRRNDDVFITPIGEGTEVSRDEYEANKEESGKLRFQAFDGTRKQSFIEYGKSLTKPGWRERLVGEIKCWPDTPKT